MQTKQLKLAAYPIEVIPTDGPCAAAVLRDDYRPCTNKASRRRGTWKFCVPHSRLDEVEVLTPDV